PHLLTRRNTGGVRLWRPAEGPPQANVELERCRGGVGACRGAGRAYLVRIGAATLFVNRVGLGAVIRGRPDGAAVAVDGYRVRRQTIPTEIDGLVPLDLIGAHRQGRAAGRRRWLRGGGNR